MSLTTAQQARIDQFNKQQQANKTPTTPQASTPVKQNINDTIKENNSSIIQGSTTPTVPKLSITDQIKANNTNIIQGNITPTTQTTVAPAKPSITDQIKANNAGIIAQSQQPVPVKTEEQRAVDNAVNYANSLYNQDISPLDNIVKQENQLMQSATSFYQEMLDGINKLNVDQPTLEDLYKSTVDSGKFQQQEKDMANEKAKIEALDLQIKGVEADVRGELQGKASESAIQQRVAQRVRDLEKQKSGLVDNYTQIYDIYSSEKAQATELLNIRVQDMQVQENRKWKMYEQKYNITKDIFNTQFQIAMKGIDRQEKDYRSKRDMEDKIQLMGLDDKSRKEAMLFEYNLKEKSKGPDIQWIDVNGTKIAVDAKDPTKILASYGPNSFPENTLDQTSLDSVVNACVGTNKQCGAFVNDYLQQIDSGRLVKNSYDEKKSLINSKIPQPGAVFIMPSKIAPEYGHTGIVESVNDDGTINIIDSNWNGDGQVSKRTISHLSVDGYYIPENKSITGPSVDDKYGPVYNSYMVSDTTPSNKVIEELGGMNKFAENAIKYYVKNTSAKMSEMGYSLNNAGRLVSATKDDKKNLMNDLTQYNYLIESINGLISEVNTNGLPNNNIIGKGMVLTGKSRDVQSYLKGDKVYALGVLNGPDLSFLESVMPTIGSTKAYLGGKETAIQQLEQVRDGVLSRYQDAFASMGISYSGTQTKQDTDSAFATYVTSSASSFLDNILKK